jgi:excinuclease ABC subunit B
MELEERLGTAGCQKLLEAQRLEQRTRYDLEMLREVGYCSGIENYSRHIDGRPAGSPPWTLIDFLPKRLPAGARRIAHDGPADPRHVQRRPLAQAGADRIRLSACPRRWITARSNLMSSSSIWAPPVHLCHPGPYELGDCRPGGGADHPPHRVGRSRSGSPPDRWVRWTTWSERSAQRVEVGERVLVTTLTKRMAEDLADYLLELGLKVHYLHSEVETLERIGILRDLRLGVFDVVVGINLLREGLDLPEVSLVAILDADKQGFCVRAPR